MNTQTTIETRRDRLAMARHAGVGPLSPVAVLAGVLVAYAAFAVLLAGAGAVLKIVHVDVDLAGNWEDLGTKAGLVAGAMLFLAYLLGGYVAGRMAWRSGTQHGLLVFLGGLLVVGLVAGVARSQANTDSLKSLVDALRSFGVPTSAKEWGHVGTVAGIASLAGMLIGSLLGGALGEGWYTKLSRRMGDVDVRDVHDVRDEHVVPEAPAATEAEAEAEAEGEPLEEMTRDELYQKAQAEDVPGRSHMSKDELIGALKDRNGPQP
jgi:hypothetical protein